MVHYQCHVHEYQHAGSDQQDGIGHITEDRRAIGEVIPAIRNEQVDGGVAEHEHNVVQFDKNLQNVAEIAFDAFNLEILGLLLVEEVALYQGVNQHRVYVFRFHQLFVFQLFFVFLVDSSLSLGFKIDLLFLQILVVFVLLRS